MGNPEGNGLTPRWPTANNYLAHIVELSTRNTRVYLGGLVRLAILLSSGVDSQDCHTVLRLAEAALAGDNRVSLFLMDDGVYVARRIARLSDIGAQVVWCSHNAQQRGLSPVQGVVEGSQFDWASMVAEADRVVSFG